MLGWAHRKFGIELNEEEFAEIDNTDLVDKLREKIREAYRVFDKERTGAITFEEMRRILRNLPEKVLIK